MISGLPTERFVFEGFLPRTGRARQQRLAEIAAERRTIVLYEAPHRIARTIADLAVACGDDRRVAVARELTKLYEDVQRTTLGDLDLGEPRGEYVIVLAGKPEPTDPPDDDVLRDALRTELEAGHGTKAAPRRWQSATASPSARPTPSPSTSEPPSIQPSRSRAGAGPQPRSVPSIA